MFYASPELTKALLEDRERRIKEMRRVSATRETRAAARKANRGPSWWPLWPRNPQRA